MTRIRILGTSAAAVLFASMAIANVEQIKEVDVTADLTAIQNADAAAYWATLEQDLEAAIVARVVDRLAEDGARITIDISELELAGAFERSVNLGDAVLVGDVNIVDDTDRSNSDAYELSVSLGNTKIIMPEGEVLVFDAGDKASYTALVETFADGVVERLK